MPAPTARFVGRAKRALDDCNESLRLFSHDAYALESRGFANFKLDRLDAAILDFNAALDLEAKLASSLYGRGLAKLKKGDVAGGNADVDAAKAIRPGIVDEFARLGVQ